MHKTDVQKWPANLDPWTINDDRMTKQLLSILFIHHEHNVAWWLITLRKILDVQNWQNSHLFSSHWQFCGIYPFKLCMKHLKYRFNFLKYTHYTQPWKIHPLPSIRSKIGYFLSNIFSFFKDNTKFTNTRFVITDD